MRTLIAICSSLLLLNSAIARARPLTRDENQLAFDVAKVATNEGAFQNVLAETALVWQVVETNAKTTPRRIAFLMRHSGRVLGQRECLPSRPCFWTRELNLHGTIPPPLATSPKMIDFWNYRLVHKWWEVLEVARRLVSGVETFRPCPTPPRTWGGSVDHARALRRGMKPLGCGPTQNEGYSF